MGRYPDSVNKYDHTPRKVFDKMVDRMNRKMDQFFEDLRQLDAQLKYLKHLEDLMAKLEWERDNPPKKKDPTQ